ncbi:CopG family transcriptional regulator [Halomonas sp. TBZ9]|uniref:CopG family transcriptional regulator n=1 Tax=Vreelandella azerica TaxID=2732867 RepID=A0A7Y3U0G8_9GAMM|nr:ribbon-helix-helix protein, CopG family [Halomonas azerica]NOG32857.1 CopG family transcriptional regulator [Halomonas azerica]
MVITKPKSKSTDATDTFISGAPDSDNQAKGVRKGNKRQISLTITPTLLDRVDELAAELGQSRAAIINMAIYRAVEHGLIKE